MKTIILRSALLILLVSLSSCARREGHVTTVTSEPKRAFDENINPQAVNPSPEMTPTPEVEVALSNGLRIVPKSVKLEHERRRYKIDVTYPEIEGTRDPAILNLNRRIRDLVTKHYRWPLTPPTKQDLRYYEKWPDVYNSVDLDYEIVLATDRILSIYFEIYSYGIGAAHSVQQSFTVNYDLKSRQWLRLSSLFKPGAKYLQFISDYCIGKLSKDHQWAISDPTFKKELDPTARNYESWNITKQGIRFNFDACKIDGCAAGKKELEISLNELKQILRPRAPVFVA